MVDKEKYRLAYFTGCLASEEADEAFFHATRRTTRTTTTARVHQAAVGPIG